MKKILFISLALFLLGGCSFNSVNNIEPSSKSTADMQKCDVDKDCVLIANSCGFDSVNKKYQADWKKYIKQREELDLQPYGDPLCLEIDDYMPVCREGYCRSKPKSE